MKRFVITTAALCACALPLLAQPPGGGQRGGAPGGGGQRGGGPGGGWQGGGQRMNPAKLNNGKPLTEAQKKAVVAATEKRTAAMRKVTDAFKADLAKALGISVAELDKRAQAAGIRLGGRGGGPGGGAPGGRGR